ncbi:MAG: hypothetical protein A2V74_09045 [Acidobacteria bacterium RBG_16_70_10]|nr:MAG: hypothetical protein A2V74_09045 [Acidobacteria bacterium RBG_16_70_10]
MTKDELSRLFDYSSWANHRVLRGAATLSSEDFRRDLGGSHGGVRGTLVHMLFAEWIWLERFKGVSPTRKLDEAEFPDLLALRERWVTVEEHRASWLASLPEDAPRRPIRYRSTEGKAFEAPLGQLAQHLANHGSYHRGQVVHMLRSLGAPVVSTDMVLWDRERTSRGA